MQVSKNFKSKKAPEDFRKIEWYFEDLCEYLKLYGARCRCVLLFLDETYEEFEKRHFRIKDAEKAKENLNPFLKYRLLVVAKDKMVTGSELFMKLI